MKWLAHYSSVVEQQLKEYQLPAEPANLYDPLRYFMGIGGKRIRPVLTLLAAELFGKSHEEVIEQAISIELFHNFTLIHDDIMDDAPLRRNMETVHERWNVNTGILSGDVLLIEAYKKICTTPVRFLPEILTLFNDTAVEVCEGQQLDMDFEKRDSVSIDEYVEMIRLKTSVLLGSALKTGAILAEAPVHDQELIYRFGQNIGIAFQIQDDILDLYADPEKFGKQVGGDVMVNKKTLLHLTALRDGDDSQIQRLHELNSFKDLELKVIQVREIFDAIDVISKCNVMMEHYYSQAMNDLAKVNVPDARKNHLLELAEYLIHRSI